MCWVLCTPGRGVIRPTWSQLPIRRFPPFAVPGPPACTASACTLQFPPSHNHTDHCMGPNKPMPVIFCVSVCVLSFPPFVMSLSHATDKIFCGKLCNWRLCISYIYCFNTSRKGSFLTLLPPQVIFTKHRAGASKEPGQPF